MVRYTNRLAASAMCWRSSVDGLLRGKRYLIHDRDSLFTDEFLCALKEAGVESVKVATAESEPECSRRENCAQHRRIPSGTGNSVWRGLSADSRSELHGPLSSGAQPSRLRQPFNPPRIGSPQRRCRDLTPRETGRDAELLLPGGCLSSPHGDDFMDGQLGPSASLNC